MRLRLADGEVGLGAFAQIRAAPAVAEVDDEASWIDLTQVDLVDLVRLALSELEDGLFQELQSARIYTNC